MKNANQAMINDFLLSVQDLEGLTEQNLHNLIDQLDTEDRLLLQNLLAQLLVKLRPFMSSENLGEYRCAMH